MSFGGTTRKGWARPFDEICMCSHREGPLVCMCTNTKEQAKERCTDCMDGRHRLVKGDSPR